jgi:hypothetical protein
MQIAVLGIDLGKNSCSVVGLDGSGQVVMRRRMQRDSMIKFACDLAPLRGGNGSLLWRAPSRTHFARPGT